MQLGLAALDGVSVAISLKTISYFPSTVKMETGNRASFSKALEVLGSAVPAFQAFNENHGWANFFSCLWSPLPQRIREQHRSTCGLFWGLFSISFLLMYTLRSCFCFVCFFLSLTMLYHSSPFLQQLSKCLNAPCFLAKLRQHCRYGTYFFLSSSFLFIFFQTSIFFPFSFWSEC